MRTAPLLLLAAVLAVPPPAGAAGGEEQDGGSQAAAPWGPLGTSRIYSVGWLADSETDGTEPRGPALLYGVRDEGGHCNCQFEAWLAAQSDEGQRVIGIGGEATRFLGFGRGPVRFGPRLTLGLEHRRRDPDAGLAGFLGIGLEAGTWIGRRALVAVTFDREIGFPADSRNQFQVLIRLAGPYGRPPRGGKPSGAGG